MTLDAGINAQFWEPRPWKYTPFRSSEGIEAAQTNFPIQHCGMTETTRKSELFSDTMDDLGHYGGFSRTVADSKLHQHCQMVYRYRSRCQQWMGRTPVVRQVSMFGGAIAGVLGVGNPGTTMIVTNQIIGAWV